MFMALGSFNFSVGKEFHQEITESVEVRFAAQEHVAGGLKKQILGKGDETKAFQGVFYPLEHGGLGRIDAIKLMANLPIPMMLADGLGFIFGFWYLQSFEVTKTHLLSGNIPQKVEFTMTLTRAGGGLFG